MVDIRPKYKSNKLNLAVVEIVGAFVATLTNTFEDGFVGLLVVDRVVKAVVLRSVVVFVAK